MNVFDFTVDRYDRFVGAAVEEGWTVLTVREYLTAEALPDRHLVLRHDVDRKVGNALTLARVEANHGVDSTYYFRTGTFDPEVVRAVEEMGHEVGYHYEDLAATRGDAEAARRRFLENLAAFRTVADVDTVCSHGSPLSPHQNTDLWDGRLDELRDHGVLGEAYLSLDVGPDAPMSYLSDTGRTWRADLPDVGPVRTTDDLVDALRSSACPDLYVLAHPCRWTDSRLEHAGMVAWDASAEAVKSTVKRVHRTLASRSGT